MLTLLVLTPVSPPPALLSLCAARPGEPAKATGRPARPQPPDDTLKRACRTIPPPPTPQVFKNMSQNVQGAIIIVGVLQLFDYGECLYLWRINKLDWLVWMVAFLFTLFLVRCARWVLRAGKGGVGGCNGWRPSCSRASCRALCGWGWLAALC